MKKTECYMALATLSFSLNAFALGLGNLNVFSSLNQPFEAEIELIDVGSVPLFNIKANVASVEEYRQLGLERDLGLDDLAFVVERNQQGRAVINIHSVKRISDPYLQLLVDLAWANGQVFRVYTVLLDPPDYQLSRRKSSVKQTSRASEPASVEQAPMASVEQRTAAPLTPTRHQSYVFQIPAIPQLKLKASMPLPSAVPSTTYLSAAQDTFSSERSIDKHRTDPNLQLKAHMDLTASMIASIRETNDVLKEQLQVLREQNKTLLTSLEQRDKQLAVLHKQIQLILRRQGLAGQVIPSEKHHANHHAWLWFLMVLGLAAGGSYYTWRRREWIELWMNTRFLPMVHAYRSKLRPEQPTKPVGQESADLTGSTPAGGPQSERPLEASPMAAEEAVEVIEGSVPSGILKEPMEEPVMILEKPVERAADKDNHEDNHVIEFDLSAIEKEDVPQKPVRSKAALKTLLELSKTYIDMNDIESARQSLQEVIDYGDEDQQRAAQALMEQLKSVDN